MLTVAGHHHDVVLAFGLHFRQIFGDFGRGRDREIAHDVITDIAGCEGRSFVAAAELDLLPDGACLRRRSAVTFKNV
jgi:hypothetical protein